MQQLICKIKSLNTDIYHLKFVTMCFYLIVITNINRLIIFNDCNYQHFYSSMLNNFIHLNW
jgi:hypothetical protein